MKVQDLIKHLNECVERGTYDLEEEIGVLLIDSGTVYSMLDDSLQIETDFEVSQPIVESIHCWLDRDEDIMKRIKEFTTIKYLQNKNNFS